MKLPYIKVALTQLFQPYSTENFPAVMKEAPERYRGRIKFHPELCIACGMCERVCAGQAITRTLEPTEEGQRVTMTFDMNSCTFCAFCADFCSRHAIELTRDYLMVAKGGERIVESGSFIKKLPAPKGAKPAVPPAPKEEAAEGEKPQETGPAAKENAGIEPAEMAEAKCETAPEA